MKLPLLYITELTAACSVYGVCVVTNYSFFLFPQISPLTQMLSRLQKEP